MRRSPPNENDFERDRFAWLSRAVPGAVYRCRFDGDWTMLLLTEGIEDLTGYAAEEFLENAERSYASIIHPDDVQLVANSVAEAVANQAPYYLRYRIVPKGGRMRWVQERGRAVFDEDGAVRWLDGYIFDMTDFEEIRQAEEERRVATARQQSALVSLATASVVAEGDIEQVAQLATELVVRATLVERASVWLLNDEGHELQLVDLYQRSTEAHSAGTSLSAADYPAYFSALRTGRFIDAHDAREDVRTSEFRDGYLVPLGITSMLDAALRVGGQVVGVLCLEHVGEPHQWRDYQLHFAGEVADQVSHALLNRARLREQQAKEQLQEQLFRAQKMEAVGRLAGGVAHDFNNLLTVITGHAHLLRRKLNDQPAALEDVAAIQATAERASELTQQLLAFARREAMTLHQVDLVASVSRLESMLERLLEDDIELRVETIDEPLPVLSTKGLLQQVLTNLVVNSRDAMPDGGAITVTVDAAEVGEDRHAELGDLKPGRYAVMHVSDTGPGIPDDIRPHIFEPFFTTKPSGKGTGLGLSTVYGIVRQSQGDILVESQSGVGTTISVYFPVSDAPAPPSMPPGAQEDEEPFGNGRAIVVAEDSQGVRELVCRALSQAGFEVLEARDAPETIRILRGLKEAAGGEGALPALVISDVVMPGGGGVDVLQWLREHMPTVPITFISGYMDERSERLIGDAPRIPKPFSFVQLLGHVRALLEHENER